MRQRAFKVAHRVHHPFGGLRVGGARRLAAAGPGGGDDRHLALHPVEHRDDRGAQQHRVGQAERVGRHVGQMLDQPDHVIAEIAEQPGAGRRQILGQGDAAFGDQGAQIGQRIAGLILEGVRVEARLPVEAAVRPSQCQIRSGFIPMIE